MTDPRLLDMEWLLDPSILGLALWICQTLLFGLMLLPDPGYLDMAWLLGPGSLGMAWFPYPRSLGLTTILDSCIFF